MSWNNINLFPYSTFNWSGIDGTQVLAHMTPVDSYNAQCNLFVIHFTSLHNKEATVYTYEKKALMTSSPELIKGVSRNKNLEVTDQCLLLFGNGDGGQSSSGALMHNHMLEQN